MLDQAQPGIDQDLYEWILWEQERLAILTEWRQWDQLLIRIESLPEDIPDQFKQQATTYEARAYLELGQSVSARKNITRTVVANRGSDSSEYETWRRLVIESYIDDGRTEDARVAMLRFDQDFDSTDLSWLLLRARVDRVGKIPTGDSGFARARRVAGPPDQYACDFQPQRKIDKAELWRQVKLRSEASGCQRRERASLWALGYYATEQMSPVDRVVALESLFHGATSSPLKLFQLPVDLLWQAYVEYAELVGNRSELLLGADEQWLELASSASKATPVKARSLFAMLMLQSSSSEISNRAASGYMEPLPKSTKKNASCWKTCSTTAKPFPMPTRYRRGSVINWWILRLSRPISRKRRGLMSGLNSVPPGTSRFDWQLRQSRVLILGGRYDEGDQVLQALISEYLEPQPEATDRILQVLFDLQTVGLHEQAIAIISTTCCGSTWSPGVGAKFCTGLRIPIVASRNSNRPLCFTCNRRCCRRRTRWIPGRKLQDSTPPKVCRRRV